MRIILTTFLTLFALFVWAQPTVRIGAGSIQTGHDSVYVDLILSVDGNDTAYIHVGDIVFSYDTSAFSNETISRVWLNKLESKNTTKINTQGYIARGEGRNTNRIIYSLEPALVTSYAQMVNNVIALAPNDSYQFVRIVLTGWDGVTDPDFQWKAVDTYAENSTVIYTFNSLANPWPAQRANVVVDAFPPFGGLQVDLIVMLQGAYNTTTKMMNTTLNSSGLLPTAQPYSGSPWNYTGTESVSSIPNGDIVDWVLVELRQAPNASAAKPNAMVSRRAGFLLKNGHVVDLDGSSLLSFEGVAIDTNKDLFAVVRHRNHLEVMTGDSLIPQGDGSYFYNICDVTSTTYGGGLGCSVIDQSTGMKGMTAGDIMHEGIIKYNGSNNDRVAIYNAIGAATSGQSATVTGYEHEDVNLDGVVKYNGANNDRVIIYNAIGASTNGQSATKTSQVPK